MLEKFQAHIRSKALFTPSSRLLLAISAGADSTVLLELLIRSGLKPALAHCNFQLRGKDSAADEQFCKQLAKKHKLTFHTKKFDVATYCREKGVNTQLAARQLRYEWFHQLIEEGAYDHILTAHHAGDVVETIFINLLRGTGINGLKGIPETNQKVIRPLLPFSKEEILKFTKTEKIKFRLDRSNNESKYERNFLRNKVIPLLRQLNPNLEDTFLRNSFHFQQEAGIVKEFLSNKAVDYCTQTHDSLFINRNRIRHERYLESILNYILMGYGFNGTQQRNIAEIVRSAEGVGKGFRTATHVLTVDRSDLIIKALPGPNENLYIRDLPQLKKIPFLKTTAVKQFKVPSAAELVIAQSKLVFPLLIRARKTGDRFRPFGLNGTKLLSDFMKEQKWNAFEKENCSLLVNGNDEIIWVMGYRSDERYKVTGKEADLLKLKIIG
jgi:tRNA(Ile)-lysidine synthase